MCLPPSFPIMLWYQYVTPPPPSFPIMLWYQYVNPHSFISYNVMDRPPPRPSFPIMLWYQYVTPPPPPFFISNNAMVSICPPPPFFISYNVMVSICDVPPPPSPSFPIMLWYQYVSPLVHLLYTQ